MICDKYRVQDQVHTTNGLGTRISHIDDLVIETNHNLHLKNILHVSSSSKNLVFVNRLAIDNQVYIEFHPFFLIKD